MISISDNTATNMLIDAVGRETIEAYWWTGSDDETGEPDGLRAGLAIDVINPGVATTADWQHVAYKGGSEPGVINLTTFLVGNSGNSYVVSATAKH